MPGEALSAEKKTVHRKIDALKKAAARPGGGQRTTVVPASQLMAAELYQEGHAPARRYAGRGPGQRKGNAMNTRSPYAGVEIPESLHGLLLPRIDQLPDTAKRSLRIAAVIGRQFPVRVLERVVTEAVT